MINITTLGTILPIFVAVFVLSIITYIFWADRSLAKARKEWEKRQ